MIHDLTKVYTQFSSKEELNSVWLEGEGRAFCAGGDVDAIRTSVLEGTSTLPQDFFYDEYKLNHMIASLKIPHISIWDGFVMGGGGTLRARYLSCVYVVVFERKVHRIILISLEHTGTENTACLPCRRLRSDSFRMSVVRSLCLV